ncbi:hypothetical protein DFH09DRAFT_1090610 [Mycena vulgaris]|nr:hypothetical protein DFH09DRAFT_1090610 [Mycena vulgaris]
MSRDGHQLSPSRDPEKSLPARRKDVTPPARRHNTTNTSTRSSSPPLPVGISPLPVPPLSAACTRMILCRRKYPVGSNHPTHPPGPELTTTTELQLLFLFDGRDSLGQAFTSISVVAKHHPRGLRRAWESPHSTSPVDLQQLAVLKARIEKFGQFLIPAKELPVSQLDLPE